MSQTTVIERLRRRAADTKAAASILGDAKTGPVRSLAYADGRRAVRLAFLGGAAASGYFAHFPGTAAEIADRCGATRNDRFDAWLRIGLELGELRESNGQLTIAGRRARAIAANDEVVAPFYRSISEYYFGPHMELTELVGNHPGRTDLSDHATTIADQSRVTEPLLAGALAEVVDVVQPATWLEIGCGSGVHLLPALQSLPTLTAVAVDLDSAVVDDARALFDAAGVVERVDLRVGDAMQVVDADEQFDIVTLHNNIYYFLETERPELFVRLASMVKPGGELIVSSQCAAPIGKSSSIAAAQLDFLLRVQSEADASLPTENDLAVLISAAPNVTSVDIRKPLPGEPYVIVRAQVGG